MAIGLGYMFGIKLPFNFNSPYKATSIIDFWRRWHMTLSRFLKHYVYIPLGGNVKGKTRRYINLMVTMLVGGLWHGANWTFVVWGGLHGMYLVINHGWRKFRRNQRETIIYEWAARVLRCSQLFLPGYFFVQRFSAAKLMFEGMLGFHGILPTSVVEQNQTVSALFRFVNISIQPGVEAWICLLIIWCIALLSIVWFMPNTQEFVLLRRQAGLPFGWRPTILWGATIGIICGGGAIYSIVINNKISEFIYFIF